MEILNIGEKLCVLGCRWRSATTSAKLEKDAWLDEWKADTFVQQSHDSRRFSIGVIEGSATSDLQISKKKLYSLAAIVNEEIKNGIAIFEISDINDDRRYWVALYHNGVPEMDFEDKDLAVIAKVLSRRLGNKIENLLNVDRPILMTNLGDEKASTDFSSIISLRDFSIVNRGFKELHLMVESGKSGGMRLNQSFTKQFDASFFKEMDSEQKKKLAVYSGFAFVGIASLFGIMYGGEDYSLPEVAQVYRPQSPVQPTRSVDVEGLVKAQIQKAIGEDLKGANKNLFFEKRERFRRAPDFVFGYKKEQMTCAINVSRCEVLYSADGAYREFNSGITSLRPLFDNVVFAVQGDTLTGIWDITQDMLYSVPTNLDDLPRNDGGESVVGNVLRLRTTRPNLSVSVSGAQLVNVSFDEIKDLDRRDLNYEFIRLGWSASGMSHQANLVVDTISRPSMAINSWRILKTDGLEQFTMNGVFLMRKN